MPIEKIIVVNDFARITGGADQVAISSAIGLAGRGYDVNFFSAVCNPMDPELLNSPVATVCLNQQDILNDPNRARAAMRGLWNTAASRRFSAILDACDRRTTIVHVHSWTKALSSSVVRAAEARNFPLVITLHDYFSVCPNGGFFDYRRGEICYKHPLSLGCIAESCDARSYSHKLWRVARQSIQKISGLPRNIRHFISVSDFSSEILRPFLPAQASIYRVDNPIAMERSLPTKVDGNDVFLYVGRLCKEKGPLLFAEAAARVGVKAIFVGAGPCQDDISTLYPQAHLAGWQRREEIAGYLAGARALVFPSLWYETQGMTVLEAAAAGVPAIVPHLSAASASVKDGVTGLWFRTGDADDLAAKIRIMQEPATAATMGIAAYERYWRNPLTLDRHLDQLVTCYQRILSTSEQTSVV